MEVLDVGEYIVLLHQPEFPYRLFQFFCGSVHSFDSERCGAVTGQEDVVLWGREGQRRRTRYLPGEVLQLVRSQVKLLVGRLHAVWRAAVCAAQPSQAHDGAHPGNISPLLSRHTPREAKRQRHARVMKMYLYSRNLPQRPITIDALPERVGGAPGRAGAARAAARTAAGR